MTFQHFPSDRTGAGPDADLAAALAEHSAWVRCVLDHVADGTPMAAHGGHGPCRLSRWLGAALASRRYDERMLRHGMALHAELHDLGDALVGLRGDLAPGPMQVLIDRLAATRDVLVELLSDLAAPRPALLPA